MSSRWAVFISGRGSNLSAALQHLENENSARISLVVSSSRKAIGLLRARRAGVPTLVLGRPIDWAALDAELRVRGIKRIFLLGFMRIVPAEFVRAWSGRIVNLHPSLLPKYPGVDSIEAAFNAPDDVGVSVHEVVADVDAGQLILQRETLKKSELSAYALADVEERVHVDEQRLVCETLSHWKPRWKPL